MLEFISFFVLFYIWHSLGTTIGYHRLLSHRSFKCSKAVEYFFVAGAYLCVEGSPVTWAVIHRGHHKLADREDDPHSPARGIWDAYIGWMLRFKYTDQINPQRLGRDLLKDPLYRFLEQDGNLYQAYALCVAICVLFRLALWLLFGPTIALASLAAGVAAQQAPLLLNVVSHSPARGYRAYETADLSTNVWWIALLTLGEGWHNNHHAMPSNARMGLKKHEFDFSWLVISTLHRVGLITHVRT